jgi:hypothetical protein
VLKVAKVAAAMKLDATAAPVDVIAARATMLILFAPNLSFVLTRVSTKAFQSRLSRWRRFTSSILIYFVYIAHCGIPPGVLKELGIKLKVQFIKISILSSKSDYSTRTLLFALRMQSLHRISCSTR